jgi:VanZ family protein
VPGPAQIAVLRALGRVAPAVLWAGAIFTLSAQSNPPLPSPYDLFQAVLPAASVETYVAIDFLLRKAGHFTEYAILAVLVHHALGIAGQWSAGRRLLVAWLLTILYAASDEWHQSFVPGRMPVVTDVVIDACGALTGLLVGRRLGRWWRAHRGPAPGGERARVPSGAGEPRGT